MTEGGKQTYVYSTIQEVRMEDDWISGWPTNLTHCQVLPRMRNLGAVDMLLHLVEER
jgi:hypothetical protein